jgi:hypothetical protein
MAVTSGTYNLETIALSETVTRVMELLRVLPAGGTPQSADTTTIARHINDTLKRWEVKGWLLWLADYVFVPLTQNQFRYTIGPNADVDPGYRPLRIREGSFIRTTCAPSPQDTQLQVISRLEYNQFTNKSVLGIPNAVYYDPQQGPGPNPTSYDPYAQGWGVMYCYPAPQDSTRTIVLDVHRPIQDITSDTQTYDLPREWYDALLMQTAARAGDVYEVPEDRLMRLKREAKALEDDMGDWASQEWAPMWFTPDMQFGYRGSH